MANLKILCYPDVRLKTVAQLVSRVDDQIKNLIRDMAETMYAAPGIGLAATQVDVHKQIIVIDISETRDQLLVFVNPVITRIEGEQEREEACLSVPGVYGNVRRGERIAVQALDREGRPFSMVATGLLAVCIQHEIDHLKGKVFVEYLSPLKQARIRTKLKKANQRERETA
jgi:peptide deformylase